MAQPHWRQFQEMAGALACTASTHAEELEKSQADVAKMRHDFARQTERLEQSQGEVRRRDAALVGMREHMQLKEQDLGRMQQDGKDLRREVSSLEKQLAQQKACTEEETVRFKSVLQAAQERTEEMQDAGTAQKRNLEAIRVEQSRQLCQRDAQAQGLYRVLAARMKEKQQDWEEGQQQLKKVAQKQETELEKLRGQVKAQEAAEKGEQSRLMTELAVSEQRWKSAENQSAQLRAAVKEVAARRDRLAAAQVEALTQAEQRIAQAEQRVYDQAREAKAMVALEQSEHKASLKAYAAVAQSAMRNVHEEAMTRCSKMEREHKFALSGTERRLENHAKEEMVELHCAERLAVEQLTELRSSGLVDVAQLKTELAEAKSKYAMAEASNESRLVELSSELSELRRDHANVMTAGADTAKDLQATEETLAATRHQLNQSEHEAKVLQSRLEASEEQRKLRSLTRYTAELEARGDTGGSREGPVLQASLHPDTSSTPSLRSSAHPQPVDFLKVNQSVQSEPLELLKNELASSQADRSTLENRYREAKNRLMTLEEMLRSTEEQVWSQEAEKQCLRAALERMESTCNSLNCEQGVLRDQLAGTSSERDKLFDITNQLRADLNRAKAPSKVSQPPESSPAWASAGTSLQSWNHQQLVHTPPKLAAPVNLWKSHQVDHKNW